MKKDLFNEEIEVFIYQDGRKTWKEKGNKRKIRKGLSDFLKFKS